MTGEDNKLVPDEELDDFLGWLLCMWHEDKMSAKEIAKTMEFGKEGTYLEKLKKHHVYYFVSRHSAEWGLDPKHRGKNLGEVKEETKQNEPQVLKVPHYRDMPFQVANYLRGKRLLSE